MNIEMGAFFVYILKSSFCLAGFYLFYRLLMSRDTFHRFNRVVLLSLVVISVVIPFVQLRVEEPVMAQQTLLDLETLLMLSTLLAERTVEATPLWIRIVLWTYIIGGISILSIFLYSCTRIVGIIRKGERQQLKGGIQLIITDKKQAPFSWMKYIVISRTDWEESGKEILTHEIAHIRSRHSWDLILIELCILFHWFNPAVWLLKQELQHIHEFEADENVLNQGIDAKKYQLLLIKKAVGSQRFTSMANSFNHSSLKKRITMMLKRKSNPWARLKYLYVLPLAASAVVVFARPEISRELEKISSVKFNEIVPVAEISKPKNVETAVPVADTIKIEIPPLQVEMEDLQIQLDNLQLDNIQLDDVQLDDMSFLEKLDINLDGLDVHIKNQNLSLDEFSFDWNEKMADIDIFQMSDDERKKFEAMMREKQEEMRKVMEERQPEFEAMMQEKQAEIERIWKEKEPEIKKQMELHQAGIEKMMKEKMPEMERLMQEKQKEIEKYMQKHQAEIEKVAKERPEDVEKMLKEREPEIEKFMEERQSEIEKLMEERQFDMEKALLEREKLMNEYLRENQKELNRLAQTVDAPAFIMNANTGGKPLYMLDGKEISKKELDELNPDRIESVSVLKDKSSTTLYGEKAKNGIVLITTKR